MIIPDSLTPLPVIPAPPQDGQAGAADLDAFVSEQSVRQLLVGPLHLRPRKPQPISERDGFAGRSEFSSPFSSLSPDHRYDEAPAKLFQPKGSHPALAKPRRAAAPTPRIQRNQPYPQFPLSDRLWVFGMGLALLAIISSGALIKFTTQKTSPTPASSPASARATQAPPAAAEEPKPRSIASADSLTISP